MNMPKQSLERISGVFDAALNPDGERKFGFVLLVFPLTPNEDGVVKTQYISNVNNRGKIAEILLNTIQRFKNNF
jgi:hypothetical protein